MDTTRKKQVLVWLTAFAVMFTMGFTASLQSVYADEPITVTIKKSKEYNLYSGYTVHRYDVTKVNGEPVSQEEGTISMVYCVEPMTEHPGAGTYTLTDVIDANETTAWKAQMRKLIYYSPGSKGYAMVTKAWYDASNAEQSAYECHHAALSKIYNKAPGDEGNSNKPYNIIKNHFPKSKKYVDRLLNEVPNLPNPPESFTCGFIKVSGKQDLFMALYVEEYGKAKVVKVSGNTAISNGNAQYSLAGAEYTIYSDAACSQIVQTEDKQNAVLVTDANGVSNEVSIPTGDYYAKETKPSPGYRLDPTVYPITVTRNQTTEFQSVEIPKNGLFDFQKYDIETGAPKPMGAASFKDAEFEVKYTDGGSTNKTWHLKTDENGYAKLDAAWLDSSKQNDAFYRDSGGNVVVPLGTVTVKETKAPEGYLLNNNSYTVDIVDNVDANTERVDTKFRPVPKAEKYPGSYSTVIPEQVIRGDVEWKKVHESDQNRHPIVPFVIKSNTTNEAHVVVVDKNGEYRSVSSKNAHSNNTNGADSIINSDGTPILDENGWVSVDNAWCDNGTWFYIDKDGNEAQEVDDDLGALPYDTYTITELPCEANKEFGLIQFDFTVTRASYEVDLGTKQEPDRPNLKTLALDKKTQSHITKSEKEATVIDTVSYENLSAGKTYTVWGYPIDKETGQRIEGVEATNTFKPTSSNGSVKLTFNFNSKELEGKTIVFFEYLYLGDSTSGELIKEHAEPNDTEQTIYIPKIKTTAKDKATGTHNANAATDVTVIDKVEYENLIPGEEYTVKGELMYKGTGKSTGLTAEKKFTPSTPNGSVELEFRFNASKVGGSSLVAFEVLYDMNGKVVGEHEDLEDPEQTVNYPHIGTTAKDKTTDAHVGNAAAHTIIKDTVKYSNLIPGQKYFLEGELMDRETDKTTGVTAKTEFIPDKASGEVVLEFTIDTSKLAGHTVVAFETLKMKTEVGEGETTTETEIVVATHKDIKDEAQSVHIPKVRTTATDKTTGKHDVKAGKITIVDVVKYTNLVPGLEYTVEGDLMDKETEKSTGVTAKTTFTPQSADGEVKLEFKIDASKLGGHKLVAYETLKYKGHTVAEHKDINDPDQTVTVKKTSGKDSPKTGQSIPWILGGLGMIVILAGAYVVRNRKELFHK